MKEAQIRKLYRNAKEYEGLGEFILTPDATQPFEIKSSDITVLAGSDADYPLQKKRHSLKYLREIAHLRPRSNTFSALFRIRSITAYAIHRFFQENDFVYVHTPIITGSDAEGAGEMFQVTTFDMEEPPKNQGGTIDYSLDIFGKKTTDVSGQLEAEIFALAFRNVYTLRTHIQSREPPILQDMLPNFWMIEPELAFCDLEALWSGEAMVKIYYQILMENAPEEMQFFNSFIDKV